jgi:hypothetical protein
MLTWAKIGQLFLSLANKLADIFRNKQLMDAGAATERDRLSAEERRRVNEANGAAVRAGDADRVPDDFYRD